MRAQAPFAVSWSKASQARGDEAGQGYEPVMARERGPGNARPDRLPATVVAVMARPATIISTMPDPTSKRSGAFPTLLSTTLPSSRLMLNSIDTVLPGPIAFSPECPRHAAAASARQASASPRARRPAPIAIR